MKAYVVPSSLDGLHDCFLEEHLRGREGVHLEMSETVLVLGIEKRTRRTFGSSQYIHH